MLSQNSENDLPKEHHEQFEDREHESHQRLFATIFSTNEYSFEQLAPNLYNPPPMEILPPLELSPELSTVFTCASGLNTEAPGWEILAHATLNPEIIIYRVLEKLSQDENIVMTMQLKELADSDLEAERVLYKDLARLLKTSTTDESERALLLRAILGESELDQRKTLVSVLLDEKTRTGAQWLARELTADDIKTRERAQTLLSDLANESTTGGAASRVLTALSASGQEQSSALFAYRHLSDTLAMDNFLLLKKNPDLFGQDQEGTSFFAKIENWLSGTHSQKQAARRLVGLSATDASAFEILSKMVKNEKTRQSAIDILSITRTDRQLAAVTALVSEPSNEKAATTMLELLGSKDPSEANAAVQIYELLGDATNSDWSQKLASANKLLDFMSAQSNKASLIKILGATESVPATLRFAAMLNGVHQRQANNLEKLFDNTATSRLAYEILTSIESPHLIASITSKCASREFESIGAILNNMPGSALRVAQVVDRDGYDFLHALRTPSLRWKAEAAVNASTTSVSQTLALFDALQDPETTGAAESIARHLNKRGAMTPGESDVFQKVLDLLSDPKEAARGRTILRDLGRDSRALELAIRAGRSIPSAEALEWLVDSMNVPAMRKGMPRLIEFLDQDPAQGREFLKAIVSNKNTAQYAKDLLKRMASDETAPKAINELRSFRGESYFNYRKLADQNTATTIPPAVRDQLQRWSTSDSGDSRRAAAAYLELRSKQQTDEFDKLISGGPFSRLEAAKILQLNTNSEAKEGLAKLLIDPKANLIASEIRSLFLRDGPAVQASLSSIAELAATTNGRDKLVTLGGLEQPLSTRVLTLAKSSPTLEALIALSAQPNGAVVLQLLEKQASHPQRAEATNLILSGNFNANEIASLAEIIDNASPQQLDTFIKAAESPIAFISLARLTVSKDAQQARLGRQLLAPSDEDTNEFARKFLPLWQKVTEFGAELPANLFNELLNSKNDKLREFVLNLLDGPDNELFDTLINALHPRSSQRDRAVDIIELLKTGRHSDTALRRLRSLKNDKVDLLSTRPA